MRPNLLFVFPDQMRATAMGFAGEDPVVTPHLDGFAAQGMFLPNAVSNHPLCSPYRASLLTGKYPYGHGVTNNCNSYATKFGCYLKADERCFSDVLKDLGYACGYIGKWHLDPPDTPDVDNLEDAVWDAYTPPGPRRHGFDFWYSYGTGNRHMTPFYHVGDNPEDHPKQVRQWSPEHEAGVAIDFISNRGGMQRDPAKPFALFVSFGPPHQPCNLVPDAYRRLYDGATPRDLLNRHNVRAEGEARNVESCVHDYFAMVSGVDEQFGRILACLDRQDLARDTVVVFTADHGDMLGSHGLMGKNVHYEESMRVPFLIRWPGHIPAGSRDPLHLSAPDLMPTLLTLMGHGEAIPAAVEGGNYAHILGGHTGPRPESSLYLHCVPSNPKGGARGVRTDRYTLVVNRDSGRVSQQALVLHDNVEDPYQLRNLAADRPDIVARLLEMLDGYLRHTRDPWETAQPRA